MNLKSIVTLGALAIIALAAPNANAGHRYRYSYPYRHHHHHSSFSIGVGFGFPSFGYGYGYPYYGYGYGYPYRYGYGYGYGYPYGYGYGSSALPYGYSRTVYRGQSVGGNTVARVQERLARAGYYHGAIDGVAGPATRRAIRAYQRDHGLRADGTVSAPLVGAMGLGS